MGCRNIFFVTVQPFLVGSSNFNINVDGQLLFLFLNSPIKGLGLFCFFTAFNPFCLVASIFLLVLTVHVNSVQDPFLS